MEWLVIIVVIVLLIGIFTRSGKAPVSIPGGLSFDPARTVMPRWTPRATVCPNCGRDVPPE